MGNATSSEGGEDSDLQGAVRGNSCAVFGGVVIVLFPWLYRCRLRTPVQLVSPGVCCSLLSQSWSVL